MAVAAPARRTAPAPAPSRTTPPPRRTPVRRPAPKRAPVARPKLAVVAGRTAVAVRHLPDSSLVVRMTRGRAWIAVLGLLLVGIVALNVATLSFAATQGKIEEQITTLEEENSMLGSREAKHFSTARIRSEASAIGLVMPNTEEPRVIEYTPEDLTTAASRLAAAGG